MFSGIIEGTGEIKTLNERNGKVQLEVLAHFAIDDIEIGESLAVNGCCLTVTSRLGNTFWADLGKETCAVTTLGKLAVGDWINLERALQFGGRVNGHLVQGHVDGVGRIVAVTEQAEGSHEYVIDVPIPLQRYLVERGSVAIDGVSLTVARTWGSHIAVCIIPHTEVKTTFQRLKVDDFVNLEVDILGKYVEKLAFLSSETYHSDRKVRRAFRRKFGF